MDEDGCGLNEVGAKHSRVKGPGNIRSSLISKSLMLAIILRFCFFAGALHPSSLNEKTLSDVCVQKHGKDRVMSSFSLERKLVRVKRTLL